MTAASGRSHRTRYHARWVLPVTGPAIADGTVIVEGDRIAWVGPRNAAPAGSDEDLGNAILVPGLVNAHTHLDLTVMRGLLEDASFFSWVRTLTAARDVLKPTELADSARLGVVEGLRAGITTFADTSPSPAAFDAMRELGARGIAYHEVFGPDPVQCDAALARLRLAVRAMRTYETPLVKVGVSPHAPYTVSDVLFRSVAAFAAEYQFPLATHIAESEDETDLVVTAEGPFAAFLDGRRIEVAPRARSPIALLERCRVLAPGTLLIHCVRVDAGDIGTIAAHGCGVAHCPSSNAKLGHGVAPLTALIAAGVRVGLGSDSMASNNRMDLLAEARLASLAQRATTRRADHLDARRALELATLGGARALGLAGAVGSLEPGKLADLAAFPVPPELEPAPDPHAALIWSLGGTPASLVVVGGRERVRDGAVVGFDAATTVARVRAAAARLAAWKRSL